VWPTIGGSRGCCGCGGGDCVMLIFISTSAVHAAAIEAVATVGSGRGRWEFAGQDWSGCFVFLGAV